MYIADFLREYEDGTVVVSNRVEYSIRDVINKNRRLFHSQYKSNKDASGMTKYFFNIVFALYFNLLKGTDIDTKDMNIRSRNGKAIFVVDLIKSALRSHLAYSDFATFVDKFRSNMIVDGTGLCKIVNGKLKTVNLLNFIIPPHAGSLQDTSVVERVFMTKEQMDAKMDEFESHWRKEKCLLKNREMFKQLWDKMQNDGKSEFVVYEYWKRDQFDGQTHKGCIKYLDFQTYDQEKEDRPTDWKPYIELAKFKTPYKRTFKSQNPNKEKGEELYPYKEQSMIDVDGRWLGFGVFEMVAPYMELFNQRMNLQIKKDLQDLRGIYVHQKSKTQPSLTQEYLNNLETGAIIETEENEKIEPLTTNRMTGDMIAINDKLFEMARMITGVTNQGLGGDLPASMPATVANIQQQEQQTTFKHVTGQMEKFLTDVFEDFYLEEVIDQLTERDVVDITPDSSELQKLDDYYVGLQVDRKAIEFKETNGYYPTSQERDQEIARLKADLAKMGGVRFPTIKKEIIKHLDYYIEFYVDNERFDRNVQIKWINELVNNPNLPASIDKERLVMDMIDLSGLPTTGFKLSEEEVAKRQQQQMAQMQAMQQGPQGEPGGPVRVPPTPNQTQQLVRANAT